MSDSPTLAGLTTYKLGGPAGRLVEANVLSDLLDLAPLSTDLLVIGRGSNLVIADRGFPGTVIRLGQGFSSIELTEGGDVVAGGAAALPMVARSAARVSRAGLEWMVGVPGSVGGAVRMNAGCFGSDTAATLVESVLIDMRTGRLRSATPPQLELRYRHSNVASHEIVVSARFHTVPGTLAQVEARMREITRWRKEHQPGGTLNAGSVFKNPPGDAAGRIIDSLGLKGMAVGGASVSDKHANFLVAGADATAQDVWDLVRAVRTAVRERVGIDLEPEIVFAGFEERP